MVEHLTPEALRTTEIIDHPNGAIELDQVFICAPNVEESRRRFELLLNITPQAENGTVFFECREGRLVIMDPSLLGAAFPGATIPRLPCIAGYSINVRDAGQTRRLIQDNGFQVHNLPGDGFWVAGDSTMGAVIRFQLTRAKIPHKLA